MSFNKKRRIITELLLGLSILLALVLGISLGIGLAASKNIDIRKDLRGYTPALPTQILDKNGNLITELFSDEKRDIIPFNDLPKHLIYALISREDKSFFKHHGFNLSDNIRAGWNIITGQFFSGASSITQQVAGMHYADRKDISIKRKIIELWWAFQIERSLTKNEILEIYMNEVYFGAGTWGVEAASQFYFGHSARDITLAESAILVIQLANPGGRYSPFKNPNFAKDRQRYVLDQMVELGYATRGDADISFQQYWNNYDYSRSNISTAYIENKSKAPYFSEYIRLQLNDMLYGAVDIYKDGFIIHTTLDLSCQKKAQDIMTKAYQSINAKYRTKSDERLYIVDDKYIPIIDMLAIAFNLEDIKSSRVKDKKMMKEKYQNIINPTLDILSNIFTLNKLEFATHISYKKEDVLLKKTTVEGALITLDNNTGHILAMIGGSDYETKQYNRAIAAKVQPGSSFKPLYYSAAISSRKYTTATRIYDGPIIFFNEDGSTYEPLNYLGEWKGSVLLRYAIAKSMNVPSLQVLQGIGFDDAIERASRMLGMYEERNNEVLFPHSYPLGLGVTAVAPINMARAFATFPNQGQEVVPIAITVVEDRSGNIILEPEKERLRKKQKTRDDQIMSPQAAYIMTSLLQSTVEYGTLANRRRNIGGFDGMPMAGKTGTTQNWGDAWTVGFSPYVTTAIWFGFDTPGISLGRHLTGATAAGPVWAEYMKSIHKGLPVKEFPKPDTGLVTVKVCAVSGMLPTNDCNEGTLDEIFFRGTEPKLPCTIHKLEKERDQELLKRLQDSMLIENLPVNELKLPYLDSELNLNLYIETDTDLNKSDTENPLLD